MKTLAIIAATVLLATPASAQLSAEAFTWGAEVHEGNRSTVISARKAGAGWTVTMECSAPDRGGRQKVLRYRGSARWENGVMLGTLDRGMRITVAPREDGSLGVVTSGVDCAQGPGLLTSGGG